MRTSNWTPSIVPRGDDQNVHLVSDDLLQGQYKDSVWVVAFNTADNWSRDLSADVAHGG
jgi:hypothetical protein